MNHPHQNLCAAHLLQTTIQCTHSPMVETWVPITICAFPPPSVYLPSTTMTNCTTDSSSSSSPSGGGLVVVAILCVVVSSLTTTFGLFFQKIAQERFAVNPETIVGDVNAYNRKTKLIWAAGFVNITLLSFALDLFSMATLGQAMVVPLLASLEVAENQMAAPFMLHEKFDKRRDISYCSELNIPPFH